MKGRICYRKWSMSIALNTKTKYEMFLEGHFWNRGKDYELCKLAGAFEDLRNMQVARRNVPWPNRGWDRQTKQRVTIEASTWKVVSWSECPCKEFQDHRCIFWTCPVASVEAIVEYYWIKSAKVRKRKVELWIVFTCLSPLIQKTNRRRSYSTCDLWEVRIPTDKLLSNLSVRRPLR